MQIDGQTDGVGLAKGDTTSLRDGYYWHGQQGFLYHTHEWRPCYPRVSLQRSK